MTFSLLFLVWRIVKWIIVLLFNLVFYWSNLSNYRLKSSERSFCHILQLIWIYLRNHMPHMASNLTLCLSGSFCPLRIFCSDMNETKHWHNSINLNFHFFFRTFDQLISFFNILFQVTDSSISWIKRCQMVQIRLIIIDNILKRLFSFL